MKLKLYIRLYTVLILLLAFGSSCRKDLKFMTASASMEFSEDTVYFDTVFTRLPGAPYPRSVNKRFMVRNPYKEALKMNITLMGGDKSVYRMNADGVSGSRISELEILPKDSLWVFVEATLEPNNKTQPAIVRDSIEFETNGNRQYVQLAAYGWDAYYFRDSVITVNTSFTNTDKPYVIVNTLFVDNNVTLNIGPGVHIYSSTNSTVEISTGKKVMVGALNVFGTLKVEGTSSNPVIFEGDRLEYNYTNAPGQWQGLHFWRGSVNNEIKHALIKNAIIGIIVDSLPESGTYNLMIRNSIIRNMSGYGILGKTASIYLENSVISNCLMNSFIGYLGGNYTLIHCSTYAPSSGRRDPHMLYNNVLRDENKNVIMTYPLNVNLINSIVWGPVETEIGFDVVTTTHVPVIQLSHNIIRAKTSLGGVSNLYNTDPKYMDPGNSNLKLKSDSPAKDKADGSNSPPKDLEDKDRNDGLPDIGAYEL